MKFEVEVERHYPHAITDVWQGLTTSEGQSKRISARHASMRSVLTERTG